MVDIDIPGGQKITIEDETVGKTIIAMRDALKAEAREAHEKLEALKAEAANAAKAKADAEAKAKAAAEAAEVEKLKQAGEFEKAMELQRTQAQAQIQAVNRRLVRKEIEAIVAGTETVVRTAVHDVVDALAGRFAVAEDGSLRAEDGSTPDAVIKGYLDARPHLVVSTVPPGTPGTPRGNGSATPKTITASQLAEAQNGDRESYAKLTEAIQSGEVRVTNT